jgi:hypothetical protein
MGQPIGPSLRVKQAKKVGLVSCPKALVNNYKPTLCNIPEERRSGLQNYYFIGLDPNGVLERRQKE